LFATVSTPVCAFSASAPSVFPDTISNVKLSPSSSSSTYGASVPIVPARPAAAENAVPAWIDGGSFTLATSTTSVALDDRPPASTALTRSVYDVFAS